MSMYDLPNENAFAERVIEASRQTPVLVDFWAEWCGPCRVVGPILEKLAAEEAAKPEPAWKLVKVNTEQFPTIAQAYRIQGIPNMKLFVDGAVAGELSGALPEPQLRAWLQEQLPSPAKEVLREGQEMLAQWREGGLDAETDARLALEIPSKLQEALDAGMIEARIDLAEYLTYTDPAAAEALLDQAGLDERSEALRQLVAFRLEAPQDRPEGPVHGAFETALEAFARRAPKEALEAGINAVAIDKNWHDEAPRRFVVALFQLLGPKHPLVLEHRRAFSMALY
jgi:putative thioredoxin